MCQRQETAMKLDTMQLPSLAGRNTGAGRLSKESAALDVQKIWGRWVIASVLQNNYLTKSPLAALEAFMLLASHGRKWRSHYYLGRSLVQVPPAWIEAIAPGKCQVQPMALVICYIPLLIKCM